MAHKTKRNPRGAGRKAYAPKDKRRAACITLAPKAYARVAALARAEKISFSRAAERIILCN